MSLEQVHVIGKNCRKLRLHWVAGWVIALALFPAVRAFGLTSTSTSLSAQTSTQACSTSTSTNPTTTTLTTLAITVTGSGGVPSGTVNIYDGANVSPIASATLNTSGQATVSLYLSNGSHTLNAAYQGNSTYSPSGFSSSPISISAQCNTQFAVSLSNVSPSSSSVMTLTAGQSGTATVTVTPSQVFVASLNTTGAPSFVTVSCSGLPTLSSCTFTPESLELLPGQDAGVMSTMLIQTQAQTAGAVPPARLAWAILLPGMLGLGGLAWGARRRRWLQRLSLVALVGFVAAMGTTGCNPRYYYYNHGPGNPPATPSGTYTVTVAGQSSNGVTAVTNTTTFQLTVQ